MPIDKAGNKYGRLTVLSRGSGSCMWTCKCDCGTIKDIHTSSLSSGRSRSCGCLNSEARAANIKHGQSRRSGRTEEYEIWKSMRQRCNNPNHKDYKHYGERGVRVCKRWDEFENFFADMGAKPAGYSIERVNNNGNYTPKNCKWIPLSEQNSNTRRSVKNKVGANHACA